MTEYAHPAKLSLPALHRALRQGTVSARSIAEEVTEAYAATSQGGGAYITWSGDDLRLLAGQIDELLTGNRDTGPLMGIPMAIKDIFGVRGFRTYAGSPAPLPAEWEQPGPIVRRILADLALITGKTHSVQFAFGGLGTNAHWGTPRNPRDPNEHRVPGGSSSGSGVAVAHGIARLAIGSDTSGSVRVPAAMTGVAGLKTTVGRWSTSGVVPLSPTLDSVGVLARDVTDLQFGFQCLDTGGFAAGDESITPPPRTLRIGVPETFFWEDCSPGVAEAVQDAVSALEHAGVMVEKRELPGCDEAFRIFREGGLAAPELAAFLQQQPSLRGSLDGNVAVRVEAAEALSAADYLSRCRRVRELATDARAQLVDVDALLTPTVAITPPRVTDVAEPDDYARLNMLALRNTVIGNLMNLCAVTLPVGKDRLGMPVGMQLLAAPWRDNELLRVARSTEAVVGAGPELFEG